MTEQPIAIGGSMDNKVSVSLEQMDDGEITCQRSWNEGEGEKREYKNEKFVLSDEDITPGIKKLFEKGAYLQGKENVFKKAKDDMMKNGLMKGGKKMMEE